MKITDDIIRDLHALVQAGEASAETRSLVAAYLAEHPALAEQLRRSDSWSLPAVASGAAPDVERDALRRTKALLSRRAWSMGLGFFFTGLPLSFIVDEHGFRFMFWPAHPDVVLGSLLLGLVAWGAFAWTTRALRPAGF
jgi:anti-sigma factor RsiW